MIRIWEGGVLINVEPTFVYDEKQQSMIAVLKSNLRRILNNRLLFVGVAVLIAIVMFSVLAPVITPYDPVEQNVRERLEAPTLDHWLGTDHFGRDMLSRLAWGARISLGVSLSIMIITMVAGSVIGLIAGYYSRLDGFVMRIMDALMAFPPILLAIAIVAISGPALVNVLLALVIVYTPRCARVVRAQVLVTKEREFVEAVRAQGANNLRIMMLHVFPNCIPALIVQQSFVFAEAIIAEATLSFVGAGLQPPTPSWGAILKEAQPYMLDAPWLMIFPAAILVLSVVGINLMGDGLRDILDPRL